MRLKSLLSISNKTANLTDSEGEQLWEKVCFVALVRLNRAQHKDQRVNILPNMSEAMFMCFISRTFVFLIYLPAVLQKCGAPQMFWNKEYSNYVKQRVRSFRISKNLERG